MNNENNNEIKPCPFCGSNKIKITTSSCNNDDHGLYWEYVTVFECADCKCKIKFEDDRSFAVTKYNSRKGNNNA
jgi:hypothetical protein